MGVCYHDWSMVPGITRVDQKPSIIGTKSMQNTSAYEEPRYKEHEITLCHFLVSPLVNKLFSYLNTDPYPLLNGG